MADILTWANREINIAIDREKKLNRDDEDGAYYAKACYESAYKAYKSLTEDGHSGMSMSITLNILNKLIKKKPLSPIFDTDDVWGEVSSYRIGEKRYQCKRMSSLFKTVHSDGSVTYSDIDRVAKVLTREDGSESHWYNGHIRRLFDEIEPIKMPYTPLDHVYKVYCNEYEIDDEDKEYYLTAVLYYLKANGERVRIFRYFNEDDDGIREIDEETFKMFVGDEAFEKVAKLKEAMSYES